MSSTVTTPNPVTTASSQVVSPRLPTNCFCQALLFSINSSCKTWSEKRKAPWKNLNRREKCTCKLRIRYTHSNKTMKISQIVTNVWFKILNHKIGNLSTILSESKRWHLTLKIDLSNRKLWRRHWDKRHWSLRNASIKWCRRNKWLSKSETRPDRREIKLLLKLTWPEMRHRSSKMTWNSLPKRRQCCLMRSSHLRTKSRWLSLRSKINRRKYSL